MLLYTLVFTACAPLEKPLTGKEIRKYTREGIILARKGELGEGKKMLERVLKNDPEKADVKLALGKIYIKLDENENAVKLLEEVRPLNSNNPDFHQIIGKAYFQAGDLKQAEAEYQKALSINPDHAAAVNSRGEIFKARGDKKKAEISYRRALKINPNLGQAHYNMGFLFEEGKEYQKAASEYKAAVSFGVESPDVYYRLGSMLNHVYSRRKTINFVDYEMAIKALDQVLSKDAAQKETRYLLGVAYLKHSSIKKSSIPRAIEQFKEAVRQDSDRPDYHHGLGKAYETGGMTDEAIKEYRLAIDLDKKSAEARDSLAALFFKQEKYDRVEELDREILLIDPRNSSAKNRLARLKKLRK
jgi:tetratricopeptide (TPR) repeat protein